MKLSTKFWGSGLAVLAAVVALFGLTMTFAAGDPNPGVLPPQSHPFGKTYGEWSNAWWRWAFKTPAPNNPLLDKTGADCSENQSGKVWFLAGTLGGPTVTPVTRDCTIPAGKALFFPIANTQQDNIGCPPPPSFSVDELRQLASQQMASVDVKTLQAQVDGATIQNLTSYLVGSNNPTYSFTLPSDNLYSFLLGCTIDPGTYFPAVSDGYYLMLAPLHVGSHTINFKAGAPFNVDVTYNLTIK